MQLKQYLNREILRQMSLFYHTISSIFYLGREQTESLFLCVELSYCNLFPIKWCYNGFEEPCKIVNQQLRFGTERATLNYVFKISYLDMGIGVREGRN